MVDMYTNINISVITRYMLMLWHMYMNINNYHFSLTSLIGRFHFFKLSIYIDSIVLYNVYTDINNFIVIITFGFIGFVIFVLSITLINQ